MIKPAQNMEAEMAVLGAILNDSETAFNLMDGLISEDDFFSQIYRHLYRQFKKINDMGMPVDLVTVNENVDRERFPDVLKIMEALFDGHATAHNVAYYAKIVRKTAVMRKASAIASGFQLLQDAFNKGDMEMEEVIESFQKDVCALEAYHDSEVTPIQKILSEIKTDALEAFKNGKPLTRCIPTGFVNVDAKVGGLPIGELIILAGRPSMGKTAFAIDICGRITMSGGDEKRLGGVIAFFSLEMTKRSIAERRLCQLGKIDSRKLKTGQLTQGDITKINSMVVEMSKAAFFINDDSSMTPSKIKPVLRELKRKEKRLDLVVVDYLQLIQSGKGLRREEEISRFSRELKVIAKEFDCPVLALAQLNRECEKRVDKRPELADLRESGGIEQDADLAMFLYRDEVYNKDTPARGKAELLIRKHRNGAIGEILLSFEKEYMLFKDFYLTTTDMLHEREYHQQF